MLGSNQLPFDFKSISLLCASYNWCGERDSNPYCTDFKSVASYRLRYHRIKSSGAQLSFWKDSLDCLEQVSLYTIISHLPLSSSSYSIRLYGTQTCRLSLKWYPLSDSNRHCMISKTIACYQLG